MRELTPRQKQILEVSQDFIAETGMPPTRAEIAEQLGFKSANAAEEHLRALQKKGVLELLPGASRGIQLAQKLAGCTRPCRRSSLVSGRVHTKQTGSGRGAEAREEKGKAHDTGSRYSRNHRRQARSEPHSRRVR